MRWRTPVCGALTEISPKNPTTSLLSFSRKLVISKHRYRSRISSTGALLTGRSKNSVESKPRLPTRVQDRGCLNAGGSAAQQSLLRAKRSTQAGTRSAPQHFALYPPKRICLPAWSKWLWENHLDSYRRRLVASGPRRDNGERPNRFGAWPRPLHGFSTVWFAPVAHGAEQRGIWLGDRRDTEGRTARNRGKIPRSGGAQGF